MQEHRLGRLEEGFRARTWRGVACATLALFGCRAALELNEYVFRVSPPPADARGSAGSADAGVPVGGTSMPSEDASAPLTSTPAPPAETPVPVPVPASPLSDAGVPGDVVEPLSPLVLELDALAAPAFDGWLFPNEILRVDTLLRSRNGFVELRLESDGLIVSHSGTEVWSFAAPNAYLATLTSDGNFVIYARDGALISVSNLAAGVVNAALRVQNDGNVVLYDNAAIPPRNSAWASGTFMWRTGECRRLPANQAIYPGDMAPLTSCNGLYRLTMEADGSLAVRDAAESIFVQPLDPGGLGSIALMQPDGNLVIYDVNDDAHGNTVTYQYPGAYAALEDDGSLVIYDTNDTRLWPAASP